MSSSVAASVVGAPTSTAASTSRNPGTAVGPSLPLVTPLAAQFREIHKNTWLKRLTAEGKKVLVGPKKSDRSWVVFCVHDDTEALLEGYAEPRQAPSHNPEWIVSMQDTLHISHALIPNSHEFEFVVTLSTEVVRFHAMSWDIMQEWVETLRSKLREMKILSPRENLYTKLPEVRAPLLPTRDPTSPLPAPPPVPAAIVPGVERVVPVSMQPLQSEQTSAADVHSSADITTPPQTSSPTSTNAIDDTSDITHGTDSPTLSLGSASTSAGAATSALPTSLTSTPILTSMSNTLTQNLLNMLSDPISAYSEQINDANSSCSSIEADDDIANGDADNLPLTLERHLSLGASDMLSMDDKPIASLLRNPSLDPSETNAYVSSAANSVRLDVLSAHRVSADQVRNLESLMNCERRIPRPHTSRSLSAGAVDKSKHSAKIVEVPNIAPPVDQTNANDRGNNVTELEVNSERAAAVGTDSFCAVATKEETQSNITIIQVSTNSDTKSSSDIEFSSPKLTHNPVNAEVFTFPESQSNHGAIGGPPSRSKSNAKTHEYKSNVQIIPSAGNSVNQQHMQKSSSIQVTGSSVSTKAVRAPVASNQYSTPVTTSIVPGEATTTTSDVLSKITTVHVGGIDSAYGTCFPLPATITSLPTSLTSTPKMPKKVILSANTSGITSISVNNTSDETSSMLRSTSAKNEYEKANKSSSFHYEKVYLSSSALPAVHATCLDLSNSASTSHHQASALARKSPYRAVSAIRDKGDLGPLSPVAQSSSPSSAQNLMQPGKTSSSKVMSNGSDQPTPVKAGSPALQRRRLTSPTEAHTPPHKARPPFMLKRGVTEAVITTRPSRRDFHLHNRLPSRHTQTGSNNVGVNSKVTTPSSNNNIDLHGPSMSSQTPAHSAVSRAASDAVDQRRRSSSTSDAHAHRSSRGANNNEFSNRLNGAATGPSPALRQPPQPFRPGDSALGVAPGIIQNNSTTSPAKRMTLREQQVMQLRREIMHPGGVRLQLRRKDCIGSIAWVDSFGAVWVAGWKQKEHPVLYNALHIGDQLLSIAGVTISSAAEANKIIRNSNTLFVEVLVRRIPFGRGYAIRREREGQCLGLIRDGNTATIVDVVPNSLAARHGLPPKAQSCDGSTLTFWVLTEINGRPLNLFFKDHEIRDRLNSVGRDISILVQPSDLITKLKKQLKSLRGYKDYLVQ